MANQVFTTKKPKDTRGTLRRILSYLASYRWIIAVILLLSVVSNVLSLLGPSFAGSAINEASAGVGTLNPRGKRGKIRKDTCGKNQNGRCRHAAVHRHFARRSGALRPG